MKTSPRTAGFTHRTARAEDSVQWLANERFFGSYRRQRSLGEGIDASAIAATYDNGVLTVTIPLAERAKPRQVDVADGGDQKSIDTHTTVESGSHIAVQRPAARPTPRCGFA